MRTWGDLYAALPFMRVDRFGPPAFFETARYGGTGRPLVLLDGQTRQTAVSGLPNLQTFPRAGVSRAAAGSPRLFAHLAEAAPDGFLALETERWEGGVPQSTISAVQGENGYGTYSFGFMRDLGPRLWVNLNVDTRQADSFVLESYDGFGTSTILGWRLNPNYRVRAGVRIYRDEQAFFEPGESLVNLSITRRGLDERRTVWLEGEGPGGRLVRLYQSRIDGSTGMLGSQVIEGKIEEKMRGVLLSGARPWRKGEWTLSARLEEREAAAEGMKRSAWHTGLAAGIRSPVLSRLDGEATVLQGFLSDGDDVTNLDGTLTWRGTIPLSVRLVRARRSPSAKRFAAGHDNDGIVHHAEWGATIHAWPGEHRLRIFRREVDGVGFDIPTDAFTENRIRLDERTTGLECSFTGERGPFEIEGAYTWSKVRDSEDRGRLPYHSDHLLRGRIAWAGMVPYIETLARLDLLGEWRSDRTGPGRTVPLESWHYLRGRATMDVNGADVFIQAEQALGHQLEYVEGLLSGTLRLYFGLLWRMED